MKIRIIKETPKSTSSKTFAVGSEIDVSHRYGKRLIAEGYAENITHTDAEVWRAMLGEQLQAAKVEAESYQDEVEDNDEAEKPKPKRGRPRKKKD